MQREAMNSSVKRLVLWNILIAVLLSIALTGSYWFKIQYIGWLIEDVPDVLAFKQEWQRRITQDWSQIKHPAVIHYQPEGCLCRTLSSAHARDITEKAQLNGFHVYQLNSDLPGLGQSLIGGQMTNTLGPIIIITQPNGRIAYAGAYSDGIRCNTGNSMVEGFIDSVDQLPETAVIGLDVQTCRCKN